MKLTRADILGLFELLADELRAAAIEGEVYLVGGAVMCLALEARDATRDVDATFAPTAAVREAASRVAATAGVPDTWLNDAVKGYLSPRGEYDPFLDLPHLRVFVARPEYLLAMKCAAMRLGEEFRDLEDVRYLLRYLNISTADDALEIVARYFDEARLMPKTRLALAELLPASTSSIRPPAR
jgi:predicted nucleotidyltransferase